MRRVAAALCLAALAGGGCQYFRNQPDPSTDEGAWAAARNRYTASAKLYDGFTTRAFASAVYQGPEVRVTRIARVATWRGLPIEERQRMVKEERAQLDQYEEFLLAFFTTDRANNDLDTSRTIWRTTLEPVGEMGELVSTRIEQVRVDATLRMLYPEVGDFDTVYRVRFPRWPGEPLSGRPFTLKLSSALGRIDLEFTPYRPDAGAPPELGAGSASPAP
ncbi:MAG TPA: hypothetical protein VFP65_26085 [Anaeromyxobacteraceae bacterium]|nr:hypothetical protein [Anaeromyxobacteraceae bacterium]